RTKILALAGVLGLFATAIAGVSIVQLRSLSSYTATVSRGTADIADSIRQLEENVWKTRVQVLAIGYAPVSERPAIADTARAIFSEIEGCQERYKEYFLETTGTELTSADAFYDAWRAYGSVAIDKMLPAAIAGDDETFQALQ